jgi:hypothetical protein
MITECPHCFRRVLVLDDGICPACQGNVRATAPVEPAWASIWVCEADRMPGMCCTCTAATSRLEKFTDTLGSQKKDGASSAAPLVLGLLFGLAGVFAALMHNASKPGVRVSLRVPRCKPCSRHAALEPVTVDFDRCRMKFAVHRTFKDAFEQLNGKADA